MKFSALVFTTIATATSAVVSIVETKDCLAEYVELSLTNSTIITNNLGGKGPFSGPPVMHFDGVGEYDGKNLHLVVSIKDGSDYVPANSLKNNGMTCFADPQATFSTPDVSCTTGGAFGQINLKGNKQETTMVFSIQDDDGNPVTLPGFAFSAYDIDQGRDVPEEYVVKGWKYALYDAMNQEAFFTEDSDLCSGVTESCLAAKSKYEGSACDNPVNPMDLEEIVCDGRTVDRKLRAFMLEFENTAEFEVYFATHGPTSLSTGRNILFAFESAWETDCENFEFRSTIKSGGTGGGGGDPHIKRWNRERFSFHGECDLLMIHSEEFHDYAGLDLHVRATAHDTMEFSYFESAALRLGEHVVEVHQKEVILDGVSYKTADLPLAFGNDEFTYTIREVPIPAHKNPKFHTYYEVDLNFDSRMLFKYFKGMLTVDVTGHQKDLSDAVGLMGQFGTGNMLDRTGKEMSDFISFGYEWQVNPSSDSVLFHENRAPQLPYEVCRMQGNGLTSSRRRKLRQNTRLLKEAQEACSSQEGGDFELCVDDVMVLGDVEAAW
mmetsp:Transcript_9275/g.17685  ORF Transcript_9275/g.17685 Transcript_9275/m.17685 type:complete len:549 (-) Transcript_9275:527-2173(-)